MTQAQTAAGWSLGSPEEPIDGIYLPNGALRWAIYAGDLGYRGYVELVDSERPMLASALAAPTPAIAGEGLREAALKLSAEEQHALADYLAANIGMVLVNEPDHPDAPGPGGFERAAEAAFTRSDTDTAVVTPEDHRAALASPSLAVPSSDDRERLVEAHEWRSMKSAPLDGKHCILALEEGCYILSAQGFYHGGKWITVLGGWSGTPLAWMPNVLLPDDLCPERFRRGRAALASEASR